jgi:hypothetical protein
MAEADDDLALAAKLARM